MSKSEKHSKRPDEVNEEQNTDESSPPFEGGRVHGNAVDDQSHVLAGLVEMVTKVHDILVARHTVRDHYDTEQVARILERAHWTVREWCRLGRVNAEKRRTGRGKSFEWVISHAELQRLQREGLLPLRKQ